MILGQRWKDLEVFRPSCKGFSYIAIAAEAYG